MTIIQRAQRMPKLAISIGVVVLISLGLVGYSMYIYYASGAYNLDLSRPEYVPVRSQITQEKTQNKELFSAQGKITPEVLDDFLKSYNAEVDKVTEMKAFSTDVLSNEQLGL